MDIKRPIVEIKNIFKSYRRGSQIIPVLQDITLDIAEGEFMALMGPSGSGKSTLLNLIAGIDKADSGTIRIGDVDITKLSETELALWRSSNVGFIFQFYNLIPVLTAFENVELPLLYDKKFFEDNTQKVLQALRSVGMEHRKDYFSNQLSGGERQRVAIARALVNDPSVIFVDEPTGNLDSKSGTQVMKILQKLNDEGKTIILVTHETFTAEHGKRIIKMVDGAIVFDELIANRRIATDGELLK